MGYRWVIALILSLAGSVGGFSMFALAGVHTQDVAIGSVAATINDLHALATAPEPPSGVHTIDVGGATLTNNGSVLQLNRGLPLTIGTLDGQSTFEKAGGAITLGAPVALLVNGAVLPPPWTILESDQGFVMPMAGLVSAGQLNALPARCTTLALIPGTHARLTPGDQQIDCTTGILDPAEAPGASASGS